MPPRTAFLPLGTQGAAIAASARLDRLLHRHIGAYQACNHRVPSACSRPSSSNTRKRALRDAQVGQGERRRHRHRNTIRSRAAVRLSARNSRRAPVLERSGRAAPARVGEPADPVRWSCPNAWCRPAGGTSWMRVRFMAMVSTQRMSLKDRQPVLIHQARAAAVCVLRTFSSVGVGRRAGPEASRRLVRLMATPYAAWPRRSKLRPASTPRGARAAR